LGLGDAGLPDQPDVSSGARLTDIFAGVITRRTRTEWMAVSDDTDACVTPVLRLNEVGRHPHMAARGSVQEGGERCVVAQPAPRFDGRCLPARRSVDRSLAAIADEWAGGPQPVAPARTADSMVTRVPTPAVPSSD
jgi:alpha-methylacyl-CoA racemase